MVKFDDLITTGRFIDGGRGPFDFDCWGLVREIYSRYGIELPDYTIPCEDASRIGAEIDNNRACWIRCQGEPPTPALVVIRYGSEWCNHTGVYIGNGRFIHIREKAGVNIDRVNAIGWRKKIEGFYIPGW